MSVEEIQTGISDLSEDDLSKVIAHAVHLKNSRVAESRELIRTRMDDTNPEHWLSIDEFEAKLADD